MVEDKSLCFVILSPIPNLKTSYLSFCYIVRAKIIDMGSVEEVIYGSIEPVETLVDSSTDSPTSITNGILALINRECYPKKEKAEFLLQRKGQLDKVDTQRLCHRCENRNS